MLNITNSITKIKRKIMECKFLLSAMFLLFIVGLYTPFSYSQTPCPGIPTVNYFGKTYHTIQIGSQCWLRENLDIGTMIIGASNQTNNSIIEKYCFNDDTANCTTYGGFYQWDEAMQYSSTTGAKGICPQDWHIPTDSEFTTLSTTVGGDGNALKAIGQGTGGGTGTNTSGFSALLSGSRYFNGTFLGLGGIAYFWCSSGNGISLALYEVLYSSSNGIDQLSATRLYGFSVRCLKNYTVGVDDKDKSEFPKEYLLSQNFPNPFNPSTVIKYAVPFESNVNIRFYNSLGQTVREVNEGNRQPGSYEINFTSSGLASGIYFYSIKALSSDGKNDFSAVKKMMLLK
jgi:uncharacterized protein (TIGR02145 family)